MWRRGRWRLRWRWRERAALRKPQAHLLAGIDLAARELELLPWSEWRTFASTRRWDWDFYDSFSRRSVQPGHVDDCCQMAARPVLAAAVLSMHPNGYVREQAVRKLSTATDLAAIPALILRATDWVAPVRRLAVDRLDQLRSILGSSAFLPALALLEPPRWSTRARDDALVQLRDWVITTTPTSDLIDSLASSDRRLRLAATRALVDARAAATALPAALEQRDSTAAAILANSLTPDDWSRAGLLALGLGSRFSRVRRTALAVLQATDPDDAVEPSYAALVSGSGIERFLAQRFLASRDVDLRAKYRDLLVAGAALEQSLFGLGEVGTPADTALVRPFLRSPQARTRAAAVIALSRLAGRDAEPLVAAMLADPSPRVARAAAASLIRTGPVPETIETAWQIAVAHADTGPRSATFRLFSASPRWMALRMACRAVGADDADLDERGRRLLATCLDRWNRSSLPPRVADRDELERSIPAVVTKLDPAAGKRLLWSVQPYLSIPEPMATSLDIL